MHCVYDQCYDGFHLYRSLSSEVNGLFPFSPTLLCPTRPVLSNAILHSVVSTVFSNQLGVWIILRPIRPKSPTYIYIYIHLFQHSADPTLLTHIYIFQHRLTSPSKGMKVAGDNGRQKVKPINIIGSGLHQYMVPGTRYEHIFICQEYDYAFGVCSR